MTMLNYTVALALSSNLLSAVDLNPGLVAQSPFNFLAKAIRQPLFRGPVPDSVSPLRKI